VETTPDDQRQFDEAVARGARLHRIGALQEAVAVLRTATERVT
jgi:hypothetical protein